jgi:hypothetical protein
MKPTETSTSSLTPKQADLVRYLVYLRYSLEFRFIGMKVATLGKDQYGPNFANKKTEVDDYRKYAYQYFEDFLAAENKDALDSLLHKLRKEETTESFKDFSTIDDDEKAQILAQRIMCRSMIDKITSLLPGNFDLAKETLQNLEENGPLEACMNLQAAHNIIIMNYEEHEKLSNTLSSDIKAEVIPLLKSSAGLTAEQEEDIEQEVFDKYKEGLNTAALAGGIIDLQEAHEGERTMLAHELGHAFNSLEKATTTLTEVYAQQQELHDQQAPDESSYTNFEERRELDGQAEDCKMEIQSAVHTIETVNKVVGNRQPKSPKLTDPLKVLVEGAKALEGASKNREKGPNLKEMFAQVVSNHNQPG